MPWYFLANSGDTTVGCGVMTGANSFVSFRCDASGCTAWLDPLFVSVQPDAADGEIQAALAANAFARGSPQNYLAEPLDWLYNNQPQIWLVNGEKREYDFVEKSYPELLSGNTQGY